MEQYVMRKKRETIVSNYYRYYKSFAHAGIMDCHEGAVSWIIPKDGEKGPALAFGIHLDEENREEELDKLINGICAKKVPQNWVLTPDATPENIIGIMEKKGFRNLEAEESAPEPAMLLNKKEFKPYQSFDDRIVCRKVQTKEDFRSWVSIVNTALHGWNMIDADNYYTWIENGYVDVYLGEIDGTPVSTAATIRNGKAASLEFVSTLEEYRRKKAASVVCSKAITDLFSNGVEDVTLSACGESVNLYKKFGFIGYFNNIIMHYEI